MCDNNPPLWHQIKDLHPSPPVSDANQLSFCCNFSRTAAHACLFVDFWRSSVRRHQSSVTSKYPARHFPKVTWKHICVFLKFFFLLFFCSQITMLQLFTKQTPPLNYLWVQVRPFDFRTRAERRWMRQTRLIYRTEVAATLLVSAKGLFFFCLLFSFPPAPRCDCNFKGWDNQTARSRSQANKRTANADYWHDTKQAPKQIHTR